MTTQAMQFHTPGQISGKQKLTSEGFLLCEEVPIARTGMQVYMPSELPDELTAGKDGVVRIHREESEVFHPDTIASFNGKPVTNDHPMFGVNPDNWNSLAVGVVQNARRGDGIYDDFLFADLLITSKEAIDAVRDGKREVSCGYDADYEPTEPGHGRQLNIIGNHVALVDKGRCGPRCAIGDRRTTPMTKTNSWKDKVLALVGADKKAEIEKIISEAPEGSTVNINMTKDAKEDEKGEVSRKEFDALCESMKKIGDSVEEMVKKKAEDKARDEKKDEEDDEDLNMDASEEEEEKERKVKDALTMVKSRAEILVPGFKLPTVDCSCKSTDSVKRVTKDLRAIKRKVLDLAYSTADGKAAIEPYLGTKLANFDKLGPKTIDFMFVSASEMMRQKNNRAGTRDKLTVKDFGHTKDSPADINKRNQDFWKHPVA